MKSWSSVHTDANELMQNAIKRSQSIQKVKLKHYNINEARLNKDKNGVRKITLESQRYTLEKVRSGLL